MDREKEGESRCIFLSKGQTEKGTTAEQHKGHPGHLMWSVETTLALNPVDNHRMIIRQPVVLFVMDYSSTHCSSISENNQDGDC